MKIVILAQTPPPIHGQAVMLNELVNAQWDWCRKVHICLDYSSTISEIGQFKFQKIVKLFKILTALLNERLKGKIDVIYYPPASANKIPFYRDVVTLLLIRLLTKKIIFQFHAGNFGSLLDKLNPIERKIALLIYKNPDAAIVHLPSLQAEVQWIRPKNNYIVPNGCSDQYKNYPKEKSGTNIHILFAGSLTEKKGVCECIQAAEVLRNAGLNFIFDFIGDWDSVSFKEKILGEISKRNLTDKIKFHGPKFNEDKWALFSQTDIFCLPTYDNETMPVSIIEAMMMALPVVSSRWRSIPDFIENESEGYLVAIKDSNMLAEKLTILINDPLLRNEMGMKGRIRYLNNYTIENHLKKMEEVFKEISNK